MLGNLFWLVFAAAIWLATFIFVPRERIVQLLPVGLLAGFLLAFIVQFIGVTWLGLWAFNYALIPIMGIPLFLPIAYIAEVIIFAHFLPVSAWGRIAYILIFSFANALVTFFMVQINQQEFINWDFYRSFIVAIVSHVIAYYTIVAMRVKERV